MQPVREKVQFAAAAPPDPLARACVPVIVVLILVGAWISAPTKHMLLSPFPSYLHADKLGHVIGFAALGFTFLRARFARVRGWHIAAFAIALAVITELGQRFIPGRTSKLGDVLIDAAAACAGAFIAHRLALRLLPVTPD